MSKFVKYYINDKIAFVEYIINVSIEAVVVQGRL